MILITGATGNLGRATINHLLKTTQPSRIVGLARDLTKGKDLSDKGIALREGNYDNYNSLLNALKGIDKVLLISSVAFVDRFAHHKKVIDAAKANGVKHIIFTSVQRSKGVNFVVKGNTDSDLATENYLRNSGIKYTILYNGLYADALLLYIGNYKENGVRISIPEGIGKMAVVTREDLAEANAKILSNSEQYENKELTLTGSKAHSFSELASILSAITGKEVPYFEITSQEYIKQLTASGFPPFVAEFFEIWAQASKAGMFADVTDHLQTVLQRKPTELSTYLKSVVK